jgi:protein SCO1
MTPETTKRGAPERGAGPGTGPGDRPSASQRRASLAILAAFALALAGIATATALLLPRGEARPEMSVIGGPFRLQSSKGGVLDSATLAGRPYLVLFGFTQCPNVCPTTLADLGTLLDDMGAAGEEMRAYYVTVDPERDTQDLLARYMASFSDRITALTGSPDAVARVLRDFRAEARKVPLPDGGYTFEHTLMVYIMDRRGGFVGPLDLDAGHTLARRQLQRVLARTPQG